MWVVLTIGSQSDGPDFYVNLLGSAEVDRTSLRFLPNIGNDNCTLWNMIPHVFVVLGSSPRYALALNSDKVLTQEAKDKPRERQDVGALFL
jgi:hypothetical protein